MLVYFSCIPEVSPGGREHMLTDVVVDMDRMAEFGDLEWKLCNRG